LRKIVPRYRPGLQRILQLLSAAIEKFAQSNRGLRPLGGWIALVITRQWSDLKVDIVSRRVGISVSSVKMDVGCARGVQTIGESIIELFGVLFSRSTDLRALEIDIGIEIIGIDLVHKGQLHEIAD